MKRGFGTWLGALLTLSWLIPYLVCVNAHASASDPRRGGTMRLLSAAGPGTLDPQVNYLEKYFQVCLSVYDGLVGYRKVAGDAGMSLVPDLAEAMPEVRDQGRTYVFHLRAGIQFSDGQALGVEDVVASFQRLFKVSSPTAASWFGNIVGAEACIRTPAQCALTGGVQADARTRSITFHLREADSDFLFKLAYPHAVIVPRSAPSHDVGVLALPGTGPYRIVSYDPKRQLRLERNPRFHEWSQVAQPDAYPDAVNYDFGLSDDAQVTAIENGQADWTFDPVPVARLNEIGTRFPAQVHVTPVKGVFFMPMNTRLPPFNVLAARQALNLALDRRALVRIYGGPRLAVPACQFLPPEFQGFEGYCPYTQQPGKSWTAPDMARARQLVKESGTRGQHVTLVVQDTEVERQIGTYVQSVLNELGYVAALKTLSASLQFTYVQNTRNAVQLSLLTWYQDYPAASDFLQVHFSCANYHPDSDVSINISGLCDATVEEGLRRAAQADASGSAEAQALWAAVDHRISDLAPVAPLFYPKHIDFMSRRVGNIQLSARYQWLYAQSWVQ